jgi:hypothetical protein
MNRFVKNVYDAVVRSRLDVKLTSKNMPEEYQKMIERIYTLEGTGRPAIARPQTTYSPYQGGNGGGMTTPISSAATATTTAASGYGGMSSTYGGANIPYVSIYTLEQMRNTPQTLYTEISKSVFEYGH